MAKKNKSSRRKRKDKNAVSEDEKRNEKQPVVEEKVKPENNSIISGDESRPVIENMAKENFEPVSSSVSKPQPAPRAVVPPMEGPELPRGYDKTTIVLMPRDPSWIYSYWEVDKNTRDKLNREHNHDIFSQGTLALKLYDVTDIEFDGSNAHSQMLIKVGDADNWYIQVPEAGRNYCCDLGVLTLRREFVLIARSNTVSLPSGKLSEITDEQWASVRERLEMLIARMGLEKPGTSSARALKLLLRRIEEILPLPGSSFMPGRMPGSMPSSGTLRKK